MRLLGMGLLAFVLAAMALLLSKSENMRRGFVEMTEVFSGPHLTFETTSPRALSGTSSRDATVYRRANETPIILTGIPAYQGASFFLPVDARPISGYLQINATTQVLKGVEGVLRVSIGNTKKAEMLLRPGEAGRSLRIELTPEEISREQLVVSFSLQGEGPHAPCGKDTGIEAIVEIETTSALHLTLQNELTTARDVALSDGKRVSISWATSDHSADVLGKALSLQHAGWDVRFDPQGKPQDPAAVIIPLVDAVQPKPTYAWSDLLGPNGDAMGLRQFQKSHSWRLRYDFMTAQKKTLPAEATFVFKLGQLELGNEWRVTVSLNGSLLSQSVFDGRLQEQSLSVPLPPEQHQRTNVIEIALTTTQRETNDCTEPPELVAELTSDSAFTPGVATFEDGLVSLLDRLANGWVLGQPELSAAEAAIALDLLATLPRVSKGEAAPLTVTALGRGTSLNPWATRANRVWVVQFSPSGQLEAMPLSAYPSAETREVMLLVDASGVLS